MKKINIRLLLFVIIVANKIYSQGRIIFNNDGFIVLKNSAYLVVANSSTNAITTSGSGGNVISEGENNRVKWTIGTSTGTFVVPFTKSSSANKIPLSIAINTAGVGSGNIVFSTYGGATWDNSTYLPSGVTNIGSLIGGSNNSAHVIDRFWMIDAQGYTTKPSPTIAFTYLDNEWSAVGNSVVEASLFAQRYSSTLNDWGMWFGAFGTANITSNTVSTGTVASADFFRVWTLVNQSSPLPIELLYFKVECEDSNGLNFEWASATESNNDYYTIEGSVDGVNWHALKTIDGAGNSSTQLNYTTSVTLENDYIYFRLKQTDFNGSYKYSDIVYEACGAIDVKSDFVVYPNPNNGEFSLLLYNMINETATVEIIDVLGQKVKEFTVHPDEKKYSQEIKIEGFKTGTYLIIVKTDTDVMTQKVLVN